MAILRKELVDDLVNWGAMNFHIKKYYTVVSQFPVHEMMMYAAEFWAFWQIALLISDRNGLVFDGAN